jgi:hypothetical protein
MRSIAAAAIAIIALVILGLTLPGGSARANGVPQLVKLTYLDGVSNWGPKNAEGVLEFSFAEAYARVDVKNLAPADGYTYEGWLTGGDGAPLLVGTVVPSAAGVGVLDTKLTDLKRYDYDQFVIAGRKADSPATTIPTDRSIAGRFTIIQDTAAGNAGDVRPATLPDTGESAGLSTRERIGRTLTIACAAAAVALIGIRFLRRDRSRD